MYILLQKIMYFGTESRKISMYIYREQVVLKEMDVNGTH